MAKHRNTVLSQLRRKLRCTRGPRPELARRHRHPVPPRATQYTDLTLGAQEVVLGRIVEGLRGL